MTNKKFFLIAGWLVLLIISSLCVTYYRAQAVPGDYEKYMQLFSLVLTDPVIVDPATGEVSSSGRVKNVSQISGTNWQEFVAKGRTIKWSDLNFQAKNCPKDENATYLQKVGKQTVCQKMFGNYLVVEGTPPMEKCPDGSIMFGETCFPLVKEIRCGEGETPIRDDNKLLCASEDNFTPCSPYGVSFFKIVASIGETLARCYRTEERYNKDDPNKKISCKSGTYIYYIDTNNHSMGIACRKERVLECPILYSLSPTFPGNAPYLECRFQAI